MLRNEVNPGTEGRRATLERLAPQMQEAYAHSVGKGMQSPVILAVDVSQEALHKLMHAVADFDQMHECIVRSREIGLFPLVLVDVAAADIPSALGARSRRAAAKLASDVGHQYFRVAVLDSQGISCSKLPRSS